MNKKTNKTTSRKDQLKTVAEQLSDNMSTHTGESLGRAKDRHAMKRKMLNSHNPDLSDTSDMKANVTDEDEIQQLVETKQMQDGPHDNNANSSATLL